MGALVRSADPLEQSATGHPSEARLDSIRIASGGITKSCTNKAAAAPKVAVARTAVPNTVSRAASSAIIGHSRFRLQRRNYGTAKPEAKPRDAGEATL